MLSLTLLLGIALFAFHVARCVKTYNSLKDFGGHWSAGWSRLWLLKTQSSGYMNKIFTEVNQKHGKLAQLLFIHVTNCSMCYLALASAMRRMDLRCRLKHRRGLDFDAQLGTIILRKNCIAADNGVQDPQPVLGLLC